MTLCVVIVSVRLDTACMQLQQQLIRLEIITVSLFSHGKEIIELIFPVLVLV